MLAKIIAIVLMLARYLWEINFPAIAHAGERERETLRYRKGQGETLRFRKGQGERPFAIAKGKERAFPRKGA